jgi:glycosyltransferase involved in cell wall biosynthesis
MKIALVCDDLVQHGGHEKVILDICRIFPRAPLYTTLATKKWQEICREEGIELKTTSLQKIPFKKRLNRALAPFLLHILALEKINFNEFDLVLSISSRFAHGVITKPQTKHICYMSTVGRMFWEPQIYFEYESFAGIGFLKKLAAVFLKIPLSYLRIWDRTAAQRVDYFIANSKTTKARIQKYYGRDSEVINPAVDLKVFVFNKNEDGRQTDGNYFLVLTRLASWKRVDIAIKACQLAGERLIIAGSGPDLDRLKRIANNQVEFLGYVSGEEKAKLLHNCKAIINTQFEDFGLVPLEAMASGRPVIAYKKGGVLETVKEGRTGEFFPQQSAKSLAQTIRNFVPENYNPQDCRKRAEEFSLEIFQHKLLNFVEKIK